MLPFNKNRSYYPFNFAPYFLFDHFFCCSCNVFIFVFWFNTYFNIMLIKLKLIIIIIIIIIIMFINIIFFVFVCCILFDKAKIYQNSQATIHNQHSLALSHIKKKKKKVYKYDFCLSVNCSICIL